MSSILLAGLIGLAPGPSVTIRVEAKPDHAISPYIYGASAVSPESAKALGLANPPASIRREAWSSKGGKLVVSLPPTSACLVVVPKGTP